ncbi:hypothetical protein J2X46_002731 [Nocardioides sp. BE266]|nr:hypothetical protein [Nocardioides sp. BE266]MDR7253741.1 hypothetical protein [Nocardioides sp. BE266]
MNVKDFGTELDSISSCTPEQHAAARAYVEANAPDCLAAIFGEES